MADCEPYKSSHTGPEIDAAVSKVNSGGITGTQGPQGPTGATGPQGPVGPAGPGVPTGGVANQILVKNSATNYDTKWVSPGTIEELRGPTGPQGPQGPVGPQGPAGSSADVDMSNLIILQGGATMTIASAYGSAPYTIEVTDSSTDEEYVTQTQLTSAVNNLTTQINTKVSSTAINDVVVMTEDEYNALSSKVSTRLYLIKE